MSQVHIDDDWRCYEPGSLYETTHSTILVLACHERKANSKIKSAIGIATVALNEHLDNRTTVQMCGNAVVRNETMLA